MTRRLGLLLGLAGLLLACGSRPEPTPAVAPPAPEVEYDGCWAVYQPGPVCALKPDLDLRFRLWVKNESGLAAKIQAGAELQRVVGKEVDGGRLFALSLPPGASLLQVRLCRADGACGPPWALALAPPEMPSWLDGIRKLQREHREQEACRELQRRQVSASAKEKGFIFRELSVLCGDAKMAEYLERGIAADHAVGNRKGEVEMVTSLSRLDIEQSRFSQARQRLDGLSLAPTAPAVAKYLVAFYRGLLGKGEDDYRLALEQLQQAADLAEQIGRPELWWKAEQPLAVVLQEIGRSPEAAKVFASLDAHRYPDLGQPCDLGRFLTNEGWSRLVAREAGEATADPIPILKEAKLEFATRSCPSEERLNALLNLALADLQAHRRNEAGQALDEARPLASTATPTHHLWWLDLEARLILEREPARALQLYDQLAGEAERALSLEGRFRAAVGLARAHRKMGQPAKALADFARADLLIDEQSLHVPVQEGRDTLVGQREVATSEYLELLLAEDERQRAFELVRRDRSRLLHQLAIRDRLTRLDPGDQRRWDRALSEYRRLRHRIDEEASRQWGLPLDQIEPAKREHADQLVKAQRALDHAVAGLGDLGDQERFSPPGKDEIILAYHPLPKGWWVRFAAHGDQFEIGRFELPARLPGQPGLSGLLLAPFQKVIKKAGRVRVLPFGSLQAVDFHALPFGGRGEPLLAHHLVIYSLDLPVRRPSPLAGRPRALLVSNPRSGQGYLPAARTEADRAAAVIKGWRGWTLERLDDREPTRAAVSSRLPDTDLFHFAGHGSFAGFGGWDSALPLADGSLLTLGDILTLRRVPRWIVLSACDAGRPSPDAPGEGIGLANAFLLAGSQAVIAANRIVDDKTAGDLLSRFYQDWQPGADLALPLQRAELACLQQNPKADCTSFRLIEP
jgi:tetratricopeptide (TPR) repeat protein